MRVVTMVTAAALMFLAAASGFAGEAVRVNLGGVELSYDEGLRGPQRDDLGPDWITYDDGQPVGLWVGVPYWSKVNFTPNSTFRLQAIRVFPLNQGNVTNLAMRLRVYSLNQRTLDLNQMVYEHRFDRLPAWNDQNFDANWIQWLLAEDDFVEFGAGETFAIMYECVGGDYRHPPEAGTGWWCLYDGADNFHRSFGGQVQQYGDDPPPAHANWGVMGGDLFLRANGEYLEDFVDLNIVAVYNQENAWSFLPGASIQYRVDVANIWDDYDAAYVVNFEMFDPQGNSVWNNSVRRDGIDGADTVTVDAGEEWTVPDNADLGLYKLWVTLEVPNDANMDNNEDGLDQLVVNPDAENGNPDQWWTYIDGQTENLTSWNESSGWAAAFWHPGGDRMMALTSFRVQIVSVDARVPMDVDMQVFSLDLNAQPSAELWTGTARVTGQGGEAVGNDRHKAWVVVEPDYDNPDEAIIGPGQAFMVVYYFHNDTQFPIDTNPPIAGTNTTMHPAYLDTQDDGQGFAPAGSGDFPIEARMAWSDIAPPGPRLRAAPDELDFGVDLLMNHDYRIPVNLISFGQDPVTIDQIRIAPSIAAYLTVAPILNDYEIASTDTVTVTFTFNCDSVKKIDSYVMIYNNSSIDEMTLHVTARTTEGVVENVRPGLPSAYELSQNHPNPFNPVTTVDFALTKGGMTRLDVFDLNGRLVQNVFQRVLPMGYHSAEIDAGSLPAGVYMYQLTSADFSATHKMVLMK